MDAVAGSKEIKKTFIVPAIKSFDHYDFTKAKICCSLTWLIAKAFGTDSVPEDLKEPFYTDQYEQEHVKPPVVNLLLSAELYCRAGSLILKSDAAKPLLGHDAVIQAVAQKGLYVTDQERLVTERDLCKRPIQMQGKANCASQEAAGHSRLWHSGIRSKAVVVTLGPNAAPVVCQPSSLHLHHPSDTDKILLIVGKMLVTSYSAFFGR